MHTPVLMCLARTPQQYQVLRNKNAIYKKLSKMNFYFYSLNIELKKALKILIIPIASKKAHANRMFHKNINGRGGLIRLRV